MYLKKKYIYEYIKQKVCIKQKIGSIAYISNKKICQTKNILRSIDIYKKRHTTV